MTSAIGSVLYCASGSQAVDVLCDWLWTGHKKSVSLIDYLLKALDCPTMIVT